MIVTYTISLFLFGFCCGKIHTLCKQQRVVNIHNRIGKPGEVIVCCNATVVQDQSGVLSWYDNDNPPKQEG